MVPTLPFDHGCAVIHSTVSKPSGPSEVYFVNTPSEPCRPRQSW